MAAKETITLDTVNLVDGKETLRAPLAGDTYTFPRAAHFDAAITTDSTVDGRDVAADGALVDSAAQLNIAQEYTKQQNFNSTTLTDAVNVAWNLDDNQVAAVTLAGNRTLDNPTNMKDGATYILRVIQDGTGSRTLAYGTAYKWEGGTAPTLSTGIATVDILTFVSDGTNMYGVIAQDFS